MIAYFTKDDYGHEIIFSNDPKLVEEEDIENPDSMYPEPIRYFKTGKYVWDGNVLFEPDSYEMKFDKSLGLTEIDCGQKIPIEINLKVLE